MSSTLKLSIFFNCGNSCILHCRNFYSASFTAFGSVFDTMLYCFSISVISNIETNGANFLLKLSLALLISAAIQFVMRIIFYILGKNDLFSFCVNSISAGLALLSFTATIFIMLVWLILKIFRIPADIIRSPFLKLGLVFIIGTIIFRVIGIVIKEFSLIAMVFLC